MSTDKQGPLEPRTRKRMARRSVFNTSFPEPRSEPYHIRFVRFGRVLLDVDKRIPEERIAALAAAISGGDGSTEGKRLTPSLIRALLIDAEVALFHLAADRLSNGESDLSAKVVQATEHLARSLQIFHNMKEEEAFVFRSFVRSSSLKLALAVRTTSGENAKMLRECLNGRRKGTTKKGDAIVNAMCSGFLDDWTRRTGRVVNYATSPGSVHHFYISAMELMNSFPPSQEGSEVRAAAAAALPELRKTFAEPWMRAVRSGAGG